MARQNFSWQACEEEETIVEAQEKEQEKEQKGRQEEERESK